MGKTGIVLEVDSELCQVPWEAHPTVVPDGDLGAPITHLGVCTCGYLQTDPQPLLWAPGIN